MQDLELDVSGGESSYVIEGWIENEDCPKVLITRSLPFDYSVGTSDILEIIVDNAIVTISTDDDEEVLRFVMDTMYTELPIYKGFRMKGAIGKAYKLEVKIGNDIFTSIDTMRQPVRLDSLWYVSNSAAGKDDGGVMLAITDPPEYGHYYRIVAKRLGIDDDYLNIPGNILDDHLFNSLRVEFPIIRAGSNVQSEEGGAFLPGQVLVVKNCMMTYSRFEFNYSVLNQIGTAITPLSSRSKITSIIEGGAFGSWSCYGVSTDTIKIPVY